MTASPMWAVVPVKPFQFAKTRLAPVLSPRERARLAQVMLEDVLAALANSRRSVEGVIVATADAAAAAVARRFDARVLVEAAPAGVNAAVAAARDWVARGPDASMVVIPSDLPQLSGAALASVGACLAAPRSVALARAAGDGGTNVLGCRPAAVIAPRFGPLSFDAHRRAARAAGVTPGILSSAQFGNDLDRPDDLLSFLHAGTPTKTHAYLMGLDLEERLSCLVSS